MSDQAFVRGAAGRHAPPGLAPARVVARFRGAMWTPLSYHHPSRTWRVEPDGESAAYVKLSAAGSYAGVAQECQRLRWAAGTLSVPMVVDAGVDDGMEWMVLTPLAGRDATDPELLARPRELVPMLAAALRSFHEAHAQTCPFDFRLGAALAHVHVRVRRGEVRPEDFQPELQHHTPESALAELERTLPTSEDLVVTHGDYCPPNILFDADRLSGFVDLGQMGVADRWRDLAVATWSVGWNIGPGWEDLFLRCYGAELDPARMRFYRLLHELEA